MKKFIILLITLSVVFNLQAQVSKNVHLELGGLSAALTSEEKSSINFLIISGTVFNEDFKTMRDEMSSLETVDLTGAILSDNAVPKDAFKGKESLKSLILPSSVVSIGDNAFWGCKGLTDITSILSSVHTIGEYAFWQCSGITDLVFPNSVQSIGSVAFGLCPGLTSIIIPASVSSIGLGAFSEHKCPLTIDPGNQYYTVIDEVLFNKSVTTLIECPVTKIGAYQIPSTVTSIAEYAFFDCFFVTSVIFPPALESIGIQAFNLCGLKGPLVLPSTLKIIGNSAFSDVVGISGELKIPAGVTFVGIQAFMNCTEITSVVIPSSVKEFGSQTFSGCTGITSITLSSSNPENFAGSLNVDKTKCVLHVPYGSKSAYSVSSKWKDFKTIVESPNGFFVNSSDVNLEKEEGSSVKISIKANVEWTFTCDQPWLKIEPASGSSDSEVTIEALEKNNSRANRVAEVKVSSSGYETQIFSVIQKGSIDKIVVSAGKLCSMLSVTERSTLKSLTLSGTIDASDFVTLRDSMPMLEYLDIADVSILAYSGVHGPFWMNEYPADEIPFSGFSNDLSVGTSPLKTIILPKTLKTIGNGAFMRNLKLKTIQFPPSLRKINVAAFYGCNSIVSLNLPSNLDSIGSGAFMFCDGLRSVQVNNSTPIVFEINLNPFILLDLNLITLYVPSGTKSAYESALYWQDFGTIIEGAMPLKTNTINGNFLVVLYPNPVDNGFRIKGFEGNAKLRLTSISGAVVFEKDIDGNEFIQTENLAKGVYIVSLSSSNGIIEKRILKK